MYHCNKRITKLNSKLAFFHDYELRIFTCSMSDEVKLGGHYAIGQIIHTQIVLFIFKGPWHFNSLPELQGV